MVHPFLVNGSEQEDAFHLTESLIRSGLFSDLLLLGIVKLFGLLSYFIHQLLTVIALIVLRIQGQGSDRCDGKDGAVEHLQIPLSHRLAFLDDPADLTVHDLTDHAQDIITHVLAFKDLAAL